MCVKQPTLDDRMRLWSCLTHKSTIRMILNIEPFLETIFLIFVKGHNFHRQGAASWSRPSTGIVDHGPVLKASIFQGVHRKKPLVLPKILPWFYLQRYVSCRFPNQEIQDTILPTISLYLGIASLSFSLFLSLSLSPSGHPVPAVPGSETKASAIGQLSKCIHNGKVSRNKPRTRVNETIWSRAACENSIE